MTMNEEQFDNLIRSADADFQFSSSVDLPEKVWEKNRRRLLTQTASIVGIVLLAATTLFVWRSESPQESFAPARTLVANVGHTENIDPVPRPPKTIEESATTDLDRQLLDLKQRIAMLELSARHRDANSRLSDVFHDSSGEFAEIESTNVAAAGMLHLAQRTKTNRSSTAPVAFERIVKLFPETDAARRARQLLSGITN